jgi:hypothetical protein
MYDERRPASHDEKHAEFCIKVWVSDAPFSLLYFEV